MAYTVHQGKENNLKSIRTHFNKLRSPACDPESVFVFGLVFSNRCSITTLGQVGMHEFTAANAF